MKYLKNVSTKIIGGLGDAFLPGTTVPYTEDLKKHPTVRFYIEKKILKLVDHEQESEEVQDATISDEERKRIAEEAIAEYKKQLAENEAKKEAVAAIKSMKKAELETKAVELGVELTGSETVEQLKEKLISRISE